MVRIVARLPRRLTKNISDMRTTITTDTALQEVGSEHSERLRLTQILMAESLSITFVRGENDQIVEITQPESVKEGVAGF